MGRLRKVLTTILLLIALVSAAPPSYAKPTSRIRATSFIPIQTPVGQLSDSQLERTLVSEIHRLADQAFAEIKAKNPNVPISQLKKVERAVVHKLKETGHLIQLARSLNPTIGVSVVATEVLVTALGFGLMATGQVAAGSAVLSFPSVPVLLSVMLTYEVVKIRLKVARELKASARELERIQRHVIGYNSKNRITSLLLQDGEIQRELELVKKFVNVSADAPQVITLNEVETIIKKSAGGENFLLHAQGQKSNKEIYATLLLQFLNDSPETLSRVLEQIGLPAKARQSRFAWARDKLLKSDMSAQLPELRKHLLEISDIQKHVDRELKAVRMEISRSKKSAKRGDITADQLNERKVHLKSEIARLHEVQIQSYRHQYSLILSLKDSIASKERAKTAARVRAFEADLAELRVLSSFARIQAHANGIHLPGEFQGQRKLTIRSCEQVFTRAH